MKRLNNSTTFIRVEKSKNYTVIHNEFLKRTDLSWKAKGLLAYILSLPDDWNINLTEIEKNATDGAASFKSGWKELREAGYVERIAVREKGTNKIIRWDTVVREKSHKSKTHPLENPPSGKATDWEARRMETHRVENHELQSTEVLNTDKQSIDIQSTEREHVLFEKWWKLYPKKTGSKKKILPKFKKAIKEVGEDQFFKATEIYLKTQDEVRFICGPEVFINQERYSKDAMETNKQIIQENNRKQMSNYKNNHYEGYDINKQQLQEAEAKRQKDVEEGYMPF